MWSVWLLGMVLMQAPEAQTCRSGLRAEVRGATPARVAERFAELAECDAGAARVEASGAMSKMIAGDKSVDALVAAIRVGAGDLARGWLTRQEPDVRSRLIKRVGGACTGSGAIGAFFVQSEAELGETFWDERWYRGLSHCRSQGVRTLLSNALEHPSRGRDSRDRPRFIALLEVWARNLGETAIPLIEGYLRAPRDDKEPTLMVGVIADAANVGGRGGRNEAAVAAGAEVLLSVGPDLPGPAIERARHVLTALDREEQSRALIPHRWRDRLQDGSYAYGVWAVERFTCKNGDDRAILHVGAGHDAAKRWPDELAESLSGRLETTWTFDGARKCKGDGRVDVEMTEHPLGIDGFGSWRDEVLKRQRRAMSDVEVRVEEHGPTPL